MPGTNPINSLVAAQLSAATYTPLTQFQNPDPNNPPPALPAGWTVDFTHSGYTGNPASPTNQFITFINMSTNQAVITFKGTSNISNGISDIANSGATAYANIQPAALSALNNLQQTFPGLQIFTDGHSLGGGMAQTFAVQNGLDGFGQNSLPIAQGSMDHDPDFGAELQQYGANNTFSEVNTAGDPATFFYSTIQHGLYLDQNPTVLSNRYTVAEEVGTLLASVNPVVGDALLAWGGYNAHSLNTVIAALQSDGVAGSGAPAALPTSADDSATVTAAQNSTPVVGQNNNLVGVTEGSGTQYTVTSTTVGSNANDYTVSGAGQPAQNIAVDSNNITLTSSIASNLTINTILTVGDAGIALTSVTLSDPTGVNPEVNLSFMPGENGASEIAAINGVVTGQQISQILSDLGVSLESIFTSANPGLTVTVNGGIGFAVSGGTAMLNPDQSLSATTTNALGQPVTFTLSPPDAIGTHAETLTIGSGADALGFAGTVGGTGSGAIASVDGTTLDPAFALAAQTQGFDLASLLQGQVPDAAGGVMVSSQNGMLTLTSLDRNSALQLTPPADGSLITGGTLITHTTTSGGLALTDSFVLTGDNAANPTLTSIAITDTANPANPPIIVGFTPDANGIPQASSIDGAPLSAQQSQLLETFGTPLSALAGTNAPLVTAENNPDGSFSFIGAEGVSTTIDGAGNFSAATATTSLSVNASGTVSLTEDGVTVTGAVGSGLITGIAIGGASVAVDPAFAAALQQNGVSLASLAQAAFGTPAANATFGSDGGPDATLADNNGQASFTVTPPAGATSATLTLALPADGSVLESGTFTATIVDSFGVTFQETFAVTSAGTQLTQVTAGDATLGSSPVADFTARAIDDDTEAEVDFFSPPPGAIIEGQSTALVTVEQPAVDANGNPTVIAVEKGLPAINSLITGNDDISQDTINNIQILDVGGGGIALTAAQFSGFSQIVSEFGPPVFYPTITGVTGGVYNLNGKTSQGFNLAATSLDGTTLIGNDANPDISNTVGASGPRI